MHVVLLGYYGFDNDGDEAILLSIINALKKTHPSIEITVLSNQPEKTRKTYEVYAVNRWRIRDLNTAIRSADGLICGGGSLLQDETGWRSVPYYLSVMQLALLHRKPVFVYAQGIGPIKRNINRKLVQFVLNRVSRITVRDESSRQFLQKIGVKQPIQIVPDPVFGIELDMMEKEWTGLNAIPTPFVTVSIRHWPSEFDYKKKIAVCLDKLVRNGFAVVFVPMHGERDEEASRETAQLMKEDSIVAPGNLSLSEKISVIRRSRLMIGMRLHSLIFSAVTLTPFIAISYDPKLEAFANLVDQPVVGHVCMDDWDSDCLYDEVHKAFAKREEVRSMLKRKVGKFRDEALETPKLVLDVLQRK